MLAVANITVRDMQRTDTSADVCKLFLLQEYGMFYFLLRIMLKVWNEFVFVKTGCVLPPGTS